jgi:hypothetical protein
MRTLVLSLFLVSTAALAADYVPLRERLSADELHAIGLSDAQVDRLDAALRASDARRRKHAEAQAAVAPAPRMEAQPPAAPTTPSKVGLDDEEIVAHALGRITGWAPGTVFTLDNGQRWQVLKGSVTLRAPLDSPRVRVVPGLRGRWFLEVTEDLPKARVFLVD